MSDVPRNDGMGRRRFLTLVSVAAGGVAGGLVGVPVIGFLVSPLVGRAAPEWRDVGAVDAFPDGETVAVTFEDPSPVRWSGLTAKSAAWVTRSQGTFVAFSVHCTHLGCQVRWLPKAELFMCPCHGGVYHADGSVAAGPPPRPLAQHAVRVRDGRVEVRTRPIPLPPGPFEEASAS